MGSGPVEPESGTRGRVARLWARLTSHSDRRERSWISVSRDLARWAAIAIPIGVIAGLGSAAFYYLWLQSTQFFLVGVVHIRYPNSGVPPGGIVQWSSSFPSILLLPVIMVLGGSASGLISERLAPEVAGHGTDQTIRSFHLGGGRVRLRVPFLKMVASALTLGTGGSGGREGPSAQIGGGFGAWWASILRLDSKDRRFALASGLGAGVGAMFRAPLGGAIYSSEIFYTQDFEPEVLFPAIIASVVSYSVFGVFYGFSTLFALPAGGVSWNVFQIPLYAFLGLVCAGVGVSFVLLFRKVQHWFDGVPWRLSNRVALGALIAGVGVLAIYFLVPWGNHFAALAALNVGYGFVQAAMLGQIGIRTLIPVVLAALIIAIGFRMFATAFTVGSGGAAGLFGSSVVIGALIGTTTGALFHTFLPAVVSVPEISAFAIVGMMAFFGGISKAPLAVLVMVAEMTGSYGLLVPAMVAIFIAYVATGPYHIYSEQVQSRLDSPAHREEYAEYLARSKTLP